MWRRCSALRLSSSSLSSFDSSVNNAYRCEKNPATHCRSNPHFCSSRWIQKRGLRPDLSQTDPASKCTMREKLRLCQTPPPSPTPQKIIKNEIVTLRWVRCTSQHDDGPTTFLGSKSIMKTLWLLTPPGTRDTNYGMHLTSTRSAEMKTYAARANSIYHNGLSLNIWGWAEQHQKKRKEKQTKPSRSKPNLPSTGIVRTCTSYTYTRRVCSSFTFGKECELGGITTVRHTTRRHGRHTAIGASRETISLF